MRFYFYARAACITLLALGAGWISLLHVYGFVMKHSPEGTHWSTGVIIAGVSELMPLGVALHARLEGGVSTWSIALLLLAGAFSITAQIDTATQTAFGVVVAGFSTLAFMGLIKLVIVRKPDKPKVAPQVIAPAILPTPVPPVAPTTAQPAKKVEADPAPATGEEVAESASVAPPTARAATTASRSSETRAQKIAAVQAARADMGAQATQAEIAERVGCSAATVSRIESQLRPRRTSDAVSAQLAG